MNTTSIRYVGLDIHADTGMACFLDQVGNVLQRQKFGMGRHQLEQFTRTHLRSDDQVVLEATMNTWAVVRLLRPFVASVTVANPLKVKHIAEAHVKTDKIDAQVLAQLLRLQLPATGLATG